MRRWWVLAVAGLVLAACAGPGTDGSTGPTVAPPGTAPTGTSAPSTPTGSPSPDPGTTVPPGGTPTTTGTTTPVPASLLGRVWTAIPTVRRQVALTFDCGGNADGLPAILATLESKGVSRATFFVTGSWARVFPTEAASLGSLGYLIGNHSDHHLDLTTLSRAAVRREVRQGRLVVRAATGVEPKPWFRFPFGAYDTRTLGLVAENGWIALGWTVDTLGWKGTSGGQSADSVAARVQAAAQRGEIVLMHVGSNPDDGSTLDADALPTVIDSLRAAGYRFVTPRVMLRP